ncbi:MAG: glycosyltransferase family 2 protein [Candidatus Sulfotelmatobacter sp.]|jgi:dolichol-phosphate mannosyltransferase
MEICQNHPNGVVHPLHPRSYPAKLSIVIPTYNEEAVLGLLRAELETFMGDISCETEIVVVNDGSSDRTIVKLAAWAEHDPRVKIIHFSRNFGHQLAATAGLDYSSGDAVVLIDADLQDPLASIYPMIERYCEGYDVVYGQRKSRPGETRFKLATAWLFYRLMRAVVSKDLPLDSGDFRLMSRECLIALKEMRETHRFLRGMVVWVGFSQIAVPYERKPRAAGATKYSLVKMLVFAWTAATSFSILPLRFSLGLGALAGLLAVEEGVRALVEKFRGHTVAGWTSLMVVVAAIGSALLISVGIIGEYLGRVFEEAKGRPLYVVAGTMNVGESRGRLRNAPPEPTASASAQKDS